MIDSTDIKIRKEQLRQEMEITSQRISRDWDKIFSTKKVTTSRKNNVSSLINNALVAYDVIMFFVRIRRILKRK